jgi:hypothetical protein
VCINLAYQENSKGESASTGSASSYKSEQGLKDMTPEDAFRRLKMLAVCTVCSSCVSARCARYFQKPKAAAVRVDFWGSMHSMARDRLLGNKPQEYMLSTPWAMPSVDVVFDRNLLRCSGQSICEIAPPACPRPAGRPDIVSGKLSGFDCDGYLKVAVAVKARTTCRRQCPAGRPGAGWRAGRSC